MPNPSKMTRALVLLIVLTAAAARGQEGDLDAARQHFETGQELYQHGQHVQAADEFVAAYAARPFPAFLYNAAVCYEKVGNYPKAVELFRRYLAEDPKAADRVDVEKRIAVLEAELAARQPAPPPASQPASQPGEAPASQPAAPPAAAPAPPSAAVAALPRVKPKGLVVIESKPDGAAIFLDDKNSGQIGTTPWNGSLENEHTIILEFRGYKTERKQVTPASDKLLWIYVALSEEHYLGWLEVRSNVHGADVFLDRLEGGAIGRTPFMGNVAPGKHKLIVSREGYVEQARDIEIERGKAHEVDVRLEPAPLGIVQVRANVDDARVRLDGKQVCASVPCRFAAPEGARRLAVVRHGKKPFTRQLDIGRTTETRVNVRLVDRPSRWDAFWQFFFAAGFGVGGYFLYDYAHDRDDDAGTVLTYTSYGLWGLGALTAGTGVYYLVREKGPRSSGTVESSSLAAAPALGPGFAGVSAALRF